MKKFLFPLQSIYQLKEYRCDLALQSLAKIQTQVNQITQKLAQLQVQQNQYLKDKFKQTDQMGYYQIVLNAQQQKKQQWQQEQAQLWQKQGEAQKVYQQALAEWKSLENLKNQYHKEYRKEYRNYQNAQIENITEIPL